MVTDMEQRTVIVWKVPATNTTGAKMRARYRHLTSTLEIGYPHAADDPYAHTIRELCGVQVIIDPNWDEIGGDRLYKVQAPMGTFPIHDH